MQVWLWNGVSVGSIRLSSGKNRGLEFLRLRALFRFSLLRSIYRGREGGPEHSSFLEFMDAMDDAVRITRYRILRDLRLAITQIPGRSFSKTFQVFRLLGARKGQTSHLLLNNQLTIERFGLSNLRFHR